MKWEIKETKRRERENNKNDTYKTDKKKQPISMKEIREGDQGFLSQDKVKIGKFCFLKFLKFLKFPSFRIN